MNPGTYPGLRVVEKKFQKWVCFHRNRLFLLVPRSFAAQGGREAASAPAQPAEAGEETYRQPPEKKRRKNPSQNPRRKVGAQPLAGEKGSGGGRSWGAFRTENRTAFSGGPGKRPPPSPRVQAQLDFLPGQKLMARFENRKQLQTCLRSEQQPT